MAFFTQILLNEVYIRVVTPRNEPSMYSIHDLVMSLRKCSIAGSRRMVKNQFKEETLVCIRLEGHSKKSHMIRMDQFRLSLSLFNEEIVHKLMIKIEKFESDRKRKLSYNRRKQRLTQDVTQKPKAQREDVVYDNWEEWLKY